METDRSLSGPIEFVRIAAFSSFSYKSGVYFPVLKVPGAGRNTRPKYWTTRPENRIGVARNKIDNPRQSNPSPISWPVATNTFTFQPETAAVGPWMWNQLPVMYGAYRQSWIQCSDTIW